MGEGNTVALDGQTTMAAFLQEALICQASAGLGEVLALLHPASPASNSPTVITHPVPAPLHRAQLILVDHRQHPLGLVPLSRLLGDVLMAMATDPTPLLQSPRPLADWTAAYLEPLLSVPANITLSQFWPQLQAIPTPTTPHWAIIAETTGAFLGLVDWPKLMHCLAHQSTLSPMMPWLADARSLLEPDAQHPAPPLSPVSNQDQDQAPQPLQAKIADLTVINHLTSALLAEVSHDLKTPLTAIVGLSHVLKNPGLGDLTQRQAQYVQLIGQKSQQLMRLVSDLLDFTQLQTHHLTLQPDVIDVPALCQQAIAQATQSHQSEHAVHLPEPIQFTIAPNLPSLMVDALRLRQILVALLRNALGLAGSQGELGLQVDPWGNWIGFTVWDTGPGIPPHQQHLVSQIPQTVAHSTPEHLYSMGLGVILAQRLAQLQGGDITFVSEPEGNQFTLLLPSQPVATGEVPLSSSAGGRPLVLVVAAIPDLIRTLTQHLRTRGEPVVIARSGPEALEKARILQPRLILLHLVLPLVSGWDVLTLLLHTMDISATAILAIGAPHQRQQALQAGAFAFLELPIRSPDLDHCLDQVQQQWAGSTPLHSLAIDGAPPLPSHPVQPFPGTASPPMTSIPNRAQKPTPINLTVLHLDQPPDPLTDVFSFSLVSQHLHIHGCRVVATDDLEEAELLAKIWHPKVILYTGRDATLLHQLGRNSPLAMLPFVLLHPELVHLGHHLPHLTIFSCPLSSSSPATTSTADVATLLQVLKVAASVG